MEVWTSKIIRFLFNNGAALFSGVLLGLASPQVDLYGLVWIAIIPLWISIRAAENSRQAAFRAFLAGYVFHFMELSWMPVLTPWGGSWIYLGWALLALYLALYFGIWGYVSHKFSFKNPVVHALAGALLFALLEWVRTLGTFGVPVGQLNTMVIPILVIARLAVWVGGAGLTFLVVLTNLLIAHVILDRRVVVLVVLVLAIGISSFFFPQTNPNSAQTLRIALIQPNIPQEIKMEGDAADLIFAKLLELSQKAVRESGSTDIVVWPETAVLEYITHHSRYMHPLREFVRKNKVSLIFGTPEFRGNGKDTNIFNSAVYMNPNGEIIGQYDKTQLVPFGEFLPLRPILYPFFRNFSFFQRDYTRGGRPVRFKHGETEIIPAICFESMLSGNIRRRVPLGSALLLVITNDAWFEKTGIVTEHFRQGQLRAIENRIPLVQVGNTGFSGYVTPTGSVHTVTELMKQSTQIVDVAVSRSR